MTKTSTRFPNDIISRPDRDDVIAAELAAAGIPKVVTPVPMGESRSKSFGLLNDAGWGFTREHAYWRATGPGLPKDYARQLHAARAGEVCIDGNDTIHPDSLNGFGVTMYHVHTAEGLAALAGVLNQVVADNNKTCAVLAAS